MQKIRGNRIDTILETVAKVERKIVDDSSKRFSYGAVGNWIIQRRYLNHILFSKPWGDSPVKIPSFTINFSKRGALRFMKVYLLPPYLLRETKASSVLVKNNIRAFYPDNSLPLTTKIMIGRTRSRVDMENEINIREKLISLRTVNIPKIIQYDLEGDPIFFSEEIVAGRVVDPVRDEKLILRDLVKRLWKMYEKFGIVFKEINDVIDLSGAEDIIFGAMDVIQWSDSWCDKEDFIKRSMEILESKSLIPVSIGHGDLSTENMIMGRNGKIYISDWEFARQMPIVFDLYGIISKVPRSREYFKAKIDKLILSNKNRDILSFYDQCFLSILSMILKWESSLKYTKKIGRKESKFERKLSDQFALSNEIIARWSI